MPALRFYKDADYHEVKEVLQEAGLFDKIWEDRKRLKAKITRDARSIIVAKEDGRIVGCIFIMEDGWSAFMWRLAVLRAYRREGIGSMLIKKAEGLIRKRGLREPSLFVDAKNSALKEFYKRRGYKATKEYTFMYKKV